MDRRSISKLCGSTYAQSFLTAGGSQCQFGLVALQQFGLYRLYNVTVGAQSDWRNLNITWRGGIPPTSTIKHQDAGSVHAWAASTQQVKDFIQAAITAFPCDFNGVTLNNQADFNAAPLIAQDVDQNHTNILVPTSGSPVSPEGLPISAAALRMTKIFAHSCGPSPAQIATEFYFNSTVQYILLFAFSTAQPVGQFVTAGDFLFSGISATVSFNLERIG